MAQEQIVRSLTGHHWANEAILSEHPSPGVAEAWSREYLSANPAADLRLVLPSLWSMAAAASEGAYITRMPGENLVVPLAVQFVGLAATGFGKSTVLQRLSPLLSSALEAAVTERLGWRTQLAGSVAVKKLDADGTKAVAALLASAMCASTVTHSGTPEGLRDNLVHGGAHRAIVTDESDALRELSAYANDSGSVTVLVRGWDRGDLSSDRAAKGGKLDPIAVKAVSLPVLMLVQPAAFYEGTAAPAFESKGLLGRWLLMAASDVEMADHYVPPSPFAAGGTAAADAPLAAALTGIAVRGARYRGRAALARAVLAAQVRGDDVHGLDVVPPVSPIEIGWSGAGVDAHVQVQRLRHAVLLALRTAKMPEDGAAFSFAQRLTSHVHRIAMARTLLDNPAATEINAGYVVDTAVRVLPWLVAGWSRVVAERAEVAGYEASAATLRYNPKAEDRSAAALLGRVIVRQSGCGAGADKFRLLTKREILNGVASSAPNAASRTALRRAASMELEKMVESGWLEVVGSGVFTSAGIETTRLSVTPVGVAYLLAEA